MYNIQYFEDKAAVQAQYGETFETLPSNVIAMYGDNEGMIFTSSDSNPYQEGENEVVELVLASQPEA